MQQTKQIYQNSNALDKIESNATAEAILLKTLKLKEVNSTK